MPVTILQVPSKQEVTRLKNISSLVDVGILESRETEVLIHLRQVKDQSIGVTLLGDYLQGANDSRLTPVRVPNTKNTSIQ